MGVGAWSNPVVGKLPAERLGLSNGERDVVEQRLDERVRERAGGGNAVSPSKPVNIAVGTK